MTCGALLAAGEVALFEREKLSDLWNTTKRPIVEEILQFEKEKKAFGELDKGLNREVADHSSVP